MRRFTGIAIIAACAGCSDAVAPPPPTDLAAYDIVLDGTTALLAGDSLLVRTLSYAAGDVARWPARVYLSDNPAISTQDTPLGDLVVEASVHNTSWSRGPADVRLRIPSGTAPGLYYLGFIVDPDGVAGDTNVENNVARSFFVIAVGRVPSDVATAPLPSLPLDQSQLAGAPVSFRWSAVARAAWYHVELDNCPTAPATGSWWSSCPAWETWGQFFARDSLVGPSFGPMAWRWRVRGVDSVGVAGPASPWQTFRMP